MYMYCVLHILPVEKEVLGTCLPLLNYGTDLLISCYQWQLNSTEHEQRHCGL